jgi:hypothetical protein
MRHAVKGAFLSGAVFPGLGQVFLKQYLRGIGLILAASASLIVIVKKTVEQALAILEKIQWEGGVIDMAAISDAAARASGGSNSRTIQILLFVVVFCWLFGMVDAYRIGRKKDLGERAAREGDRCLDGL